MDKSVPLALILLFAILHYSCQSPIGSKPKLLLVSFDGFRWDYLTKTDTPNFDRIIKGGVKAKWIKDSYTSLTFPNHYTIVTGLYEESHGIIANIFYDPVFNEVFDIHNRTTVEDGKFWGGEPIWVTSELHGQASGVYYWVGSEAPIKGIRPHFYKIYKKENTTMPVWEKRVDTVIGWLTEEDPVINLALLYFREPDGVGHYFGPESQEVVDMVKQCDKIIGYLLDEVEDKGLQDELNIIITSDHGMTSMNRSRFITLDDHIDVNETNHLLNYVIGTSVWPKQEEGIEEELYQNLSSIDEEHVYVWKKDEIPPEYHYKNNRRVPPILLSAKEGWGIKVNWDDKHYLLGRHGFNNSNMDMHPFFVAKGPAFKKNLISEPFENIHIYELMCHILNLTPAPNNGSIDSVRHLLVDNNILPDYSMAKWIGICIGLFVGFIFMVYIFKELCRGTGKQYPGMGKNYGDDSGRLLLAGPEEL